jgi:hypothetical protein
MRLDMDVKARQNKKQELLDPFTKRLLTLLVVTVPVLAYLILKPSSQTQVSNVEQAKAFAQFIETQPELAVKRDVASAQHAPAAAKKPVHAMPVPVAGAVPEPTAFDPNTALTLDDRIEINNMASAWNQVDFVRDHTWRDQIEGMFSIAERSQSPDVYDLLRRQIILGKVDEDQSNRARAQTWYERYMKIENRPIPRKEMEDLFSNSGN